MLTDMNSARSSTTPGSRSKAIWGSDVVVGLPGGIFVDVNINGQGMATNGTGRSCRAIRLPKYRPIIQKSDVQIINTGDTIKKND